MDHPGTRTLYEYWNELRAGRDAPSRSEVDPRRVAGELETMFILERLAGDQLRFRLAGTRLCDLLGMEARGLAAEALMEEGHGSQLRDLGLQALEAPGVGMMRVEAGDGDGVRWDGEMILLPLRSELGEMTRLMGAVNLAPGRRSRRPSPPLRLRWVGSRMSPVAVDPFAPAARPPLPAPRPAAAGFAERGAVFEGAPKVEARPALVAIEGNPDARRDAEPAERPNLRLVD